MATPQLTFYDFDQVTVAVGPIPVDGFADGEAVVIEQEEATFSHVVGADGKVVRNKTLQRTATVTLNLLQTSAANALLSALHILDRDAPGGAGVVPLLIKDKLGFSLYTAAQAWIMTPPQVTFDREATTRTWVLACAKLERFDGGAVF